MKFFLLSFFFYFALLAEPLALRFSPKNFDYLFSAQPESMASIPMIMDHMKSKHEKSPKMQWCQEVGISLDNMTSFAFTANLSEFIKLSPGDLIFTGTPAGIGATQGKLLKDGDTLSTSIHGIGTIENKCVRISDHTNASFIPEFLLGKMPSTD